MFNGSANLTKFHRRKSHNSYPKDPYLLCRKALRNGIELRFCYLYAIFPGVFFLVDLSFRRRRPMNISGAVARNPRFHHIKIVLC